MLNVASASANSPLHAVKAQTLALCSGSDSLLPSQEEDQRLRGCLWSEICRFEAKGHSFFLEVIVVTVNKGASFYHRGKFHDYVSDDIPPAYSEFKVLHDSSRWLIDVTSPVMLSTLENGELVKGLAVISSEGPVLFVRYHMLLGLELPPMIARIFAERNILVRGIAHPMVFTKLKDGK